MREYLVGRFGKDARRWKGENASYEAKHIWIVKHYGNANHCENNSLHKSKRFEWANISGEYKREISDYKQLCTRCHRKMDLLKSITHCPQGHEYSGINTVFNSRGHRQCRICRTEQQRRYRLCHGK